VAVTLTNEKVRQLTAGDLDAVVPVAPAPPPVPTPPVVHPNIGELKALDPDDPILERVEDLLTSYGGVIFVGPPGTGKSYYAARVAVTLAESDPKRFRFVQFHPSYQYEDFVEGYVPKEDGSGFELTPKHLMAVCKEAEGTSSQVVLVIDELSRGDPGRVFGEALTYLEKSKRGMQFRLASGTALTVPSNLVILATMNPLDRGVDEVDAALERRFAKIEMRPEADALELNLSSEGMDDALKQRVLHFFRVVNGRAESNPFAAVGHTYFFGVKDVGGLVRLWEHQLRFHFEKAYRLDPAGRDEVFRQWDRVLGHEAAEDVADEPAETEEGDEGAAVVGEPN
jgi:5-methylcytosine-specific restriction protein B